MISFIKKGIDTSDANAVPADITMNKTAYVNGEKITGNIPLFPNSRTYTADGYVTNDTENSKIKLSTMNATKQILDSNVNIEMSTDYYDIANAINLTADKVKKDETVLGVTGTLEEGEDINEYISLPENTTSLKIAYCIKKIPSLDTSNATNLALMFEDCSSLTNIPQLNTSNATNMASMFRGCSSLIEIPEMDTSKATGMTYMFAECSSLVSIPELDTSRATSVNNMFEDCSSLKTIPTLDISRATTTSAMFMGCTSLETIPLLDVSSSNNLINMFLNCNSLSNDSLINILSMLLTVKSSYGKDKTLKHIGLSQKQATTCTTLSNWAACEAAGWTTGY